METIYTVEYFIRKFEAIPEEMWLINSQGEEEPNGTRPHCAIGWCRNEKGFYGRASGRIKAPFENNGHSYEAHALTNLFNLVGKYKEDIYGFNVASINNGDHAQYQQTTPKQRILAALRDIQAMQTLKAPEPTLEKERIIYVTVDASVRELQKEELSQN